MATLYWEGKADAVAQVSTGTIDNFDGATTYIVTIGGVQVSVVGDTDVATTAGNLNTALNNSTHPYFAAVTWTNPSGGTITGTADTAGVPFVATLTVSGGTGTVTDFSDTTASSGPNDWSTADNWSTGAVPVNSDDVIIKDNSVNIAWGLAQSAVTLDSLTILKTYTGRIGLDYTVFATSADAETTDAAKNEYRDQYLAIGATVLDIGQHDGPSSPAGSGRLMIDLGTVASQVTIHDTAQTPTETGRAAVRLKANSASTDVFVRLALGGVGIANEVPGETSTVGDVTVSDTGTTSRIFLSDGVTLTNYAQTGGTNVLNAAATITDVRVDGGTLSIEGDFTITLCTVNGGTVLANHLKTAGNAFTTLTLNGGTTDASENAEARTWATVNLNAGATLVGDGNNLTITTLNEDGGPYTLAAS